MRAPHNPSRRFLLALAPAVLMMPACGDDGGGSDKDTAVADSAGDTTPDTGGDVATDTGVEETTATTADADDADAVTPPAHPFAFGIERGQPIGAGPFPSDLLIGDDGFVDVGPLVGDAHWGALGKAEILTRTDTQIARRRGFSFASSVYFPMNAEPEMATVWGHVSFVALTGPEAGTTFPAEVFWSAPGQMLGAFPVWGHYLVPGAKYAVVVGTGLKTTAGDNILVHPDFAALMAAEAPADASAEVVRARAAFAELRTWLATRDESATVATVFTTEDSMSYLDALMDAAREFPLVTPTRRVRSSATASLTWEEAVDVKGADLADYFGAQGTGAFRYTPGGWGPGNREAAKALNGGVAYEGGTFASGVGYVINGSIAAPSFNMYIDEASGAVTPGALHLDDSGKPEPTSTVLVPFSLFLCTSQLDGGVPVTTAIDVAIFTHGGTALRSDALAFAVANCQANRATIAMDLPFHGGRQAVKWFDGAGVVPVQADLVNTYKADGAGGRTSDYIGDNGGATATVGGFFALGQNLDPEIIEANHLAVTVETETLVRYLKEPGANGLGAALGLTFDTSNLVHESLSFGTSFGTAFMAQSEDLAAAVVSVGSGQMSSINLPMAPNNANLASNLMVAVLGLTTSVPDLTQGAYRDPVLSLVQWLAQRGDPIAYAPFVLRYREHAKPFHVIGFGDSWDETLFTPAQVTFANAWGLPVFTTQGWELQAGTPGGDSIEATAFPAQPPANNLTVGDATVSAGYFYFGEACHAEVVVPLCESNYQPPYPPITARATQLVSASPICAIHQVVIPFLQDLDGGGDVQIRAPAPVDNAICAELYD